MERLFAPADTSGHKTLLGVIWVALQGAAVYAGALALAVLFGLVAAVAGLHGAREWRRARRRPSRLVAGVSSLAVPLAAVSSPGAAGVAVLVATAASVVAAAGPTGARRARQSVLGTAGTTIRCWLGPAMAATAVVLVAAFAWQTVGALLVLLAGYDAGSYLWSSEDDGPLVGRVFGIITVAVIGFALGVVQLVVSLEPFQSMAAVLIFAGLIATLAPLGQVVASALLPAAAAEAPALRRLDTLVLAGPAWVFALWGYVDVTVR